MPTDGRWARAHPAGLVLLSIAFILERSREIGPRVHATARVQSWRFGSAYRPSGGWPVSAARTCVLTALAVMLSITPMCSRWAPRVLYNASDSVPRGWYRVTPADQLTEGELVAVRLPVAAAELAASRGYLPMGVPLIKRVAAIHGQFVCVLAEAVYVDGVRVATLRGRDRTGRVLHAWLGCRALDGGELFLLGDHEASFDSRYVGPLRTSYVIGRAVALQLW